MAGRPRSTSGWTVACLLLAAIGCSGAAGPARYRVSGRVTCGGEPVPYGEVLFSPDGTKGNTGPQGVAAIKDGRYDTAGSRAPGIGGGPMIVRVTALRTPSDGLIAEQELELEFPAADSERDLEIPKPAKAPASRPEI